MAERIKSGIKRHRQSLKKRERNTVIKSDLKTQLKKFDTALESKDVETAKNALKETEAKLRKAATKGIIKKETASRKVSRLSKKVSALSS
ncbi:MAG: 30S ribosomal protein S20 [Thermodesulfobacteriota bacterium]